MANTNRLTGKDLQVVFQTGGQQIRLDGDQTNFEVTWNTQFADVTASVDGGVFEIPTLQEISATLDAFWDTADVAVWTLITPQVLGTLLFGPRGTGTGKQKGGFIAHIQSKPLSVPFNDGIRRTVEFRGRGTMLFDIDTATF